MKAYESVLCPITNLCPKLDKVPMLPPKRIRLPGRPKKARKKELDEQPRGYNGPQMLRREGIIRIPLEHAQIQIYTCQLNEADVERGV